MSRPDLSFLFHAQAPDDEGHGESPQPSPERRSAAHRPEGPLAELIAELRQLGCGVVLIGDGDVAGVIAVTDEETTVDLYMGQGGAPEGVLAAAALRCVGGQFNGRLVFRNEDEKARARKWGITDLDRIYKLDDLAKGDCIFAATGVTDGSLLGGVKRRRKPTGETILTTESVVMRASSGTVRWIRGEHRIG